MHTQNRRALLIAAGVAIAVVASSVWWLSGADERRVNAACGTWLEHRESLRTVLAESDEAVDRAQAAHATRTGAYFNDVDRELVALARWADLGPHVIERLDQSEGASRLERGAVTSLGFVQSGLADLHKVIEHEDPSEVAFWIPELAARFQYVDDVCLTAARSH